MNIKELRKELGLTQTELAIKCEVSLTTIQLWERGVTKPSVENELKLKQALKLDK
jgi:transcriptional regulator with XRE-family HTH domain